MSSNEGPIANIHLGSNGDGAVSQAPVDIHTPPVGFETVLSPRIPVGFVPEPTIEYRTRRKQLRNTVNSGKPEPSASLPAPTSIPIPPIVLKGPRVLMYKQDPSVAEIGIRKAYLPGLVSTGPLDARIRIQGVAPVAKNAMGDLIGPTPGTEGFDAIHTFAVVRQTLTMYQRALGGVQLPWQWNSATNTNPLNVFPRAGVTANAFYSRGEQALKFFFFTPSGSPPGTPQVFTCRSLDIVAHETGHAILDALKPGWLLSGNPPQTGGLHESFGDLTAIFLTLSQMDQCEAFIAQTKADLHAKSFLSDLAEQFGLALGRPNGLRNADNDFKLSEVGNEVHAISQVFTGGIYDVLADIFAFERRVNLEDEAMTLYRVAAYLRGLVLRAIIAAPASGATYASVVNQMLTISAADGKPVEYRNFLRNRFTFREVVVALTPFALDQGVDLELAPGISDPEGATQDRHSCCGTMQHPQYDEDLDEVLQAEIDELAGIFAEGSEVGKMLFAANAEENGSHRRSTSGRKARSRGSQDH
jgi:hypothetical protein